MTAAAMSDPTPPGPMTFLERDSIEWLAAWRTLAIALGTDDVEALDADSGERWQYMGSSYVGGGAWAHHFRHRHHPMTGRREYVDVPATAGFQPEVT